MSPAPGNIKKKCVPWFSDLPGDHLVTSVHVRPFVIHQLQLMDVQQMLNDNPFLALELLPADEAGPVLRDRLRSTKSKNIQKCFYVLKSFKGQFTHQTYGLNR